MQKINYSHLIELACRIYVFIFMSIYGLAKLFGGQFYTPDRLPQNVAETSIGQVADFDLAWTFMGRSFGYMLFIGLSEVIGAWLLLWHKTKLLGALVLSTILLNVIVFDIFFLDAYGALSSAVIYLVMCSTVLFINRDRMLQALAPLFTTRLAHASFKNKLATYALAAVLMGLVFVVNQLIVNLLGHGKG